jgi:HlyD family secretion protein
LAELRIADTSAQDVRLDSSPARRRRWLVAGAVTGAVVLIAALTAPWILRWSGTDASVPRAQLRSAIVTRGDLVRDASVQGRVVAAWSPPLYATQSGTITFAVESGDTVERGAVLATIDSPEIGNRLAQERANHARLKIEIERQEIEAKQQRLENRKTVDLARVMLEATSREARRADLAMEKGAIAQLDFEKAHDERRSAELAFAHAEADAELDTERLDFEIATRRIEFDRQGLLLEDLERQVAELTIVSPVDGIVGNRLVEQKTAVSRNLPVLAVVDLTRFEVEARVPESYADDLAVGMAAEVRAGATVAPATLVAVSPEIIDNQVTARLRFDGDMPPGLRQNQRLTTRILLESRPDVLLVARGQFLESGGGRIAYRIEDRIARRTAIEVGARSIAAVEILSGLAVGDEIVVSGTEGFEGKDTVLITE